MWYLEDIPLYNGANQPPLSVTAANKEVKSALCTRANDPGYPYGESSSGQRLGEGRRVSSGASTFLSGRSEGLMDRRKNTEDHFIRSPGSNCSINFERRLRSEESTPSSSWMYEEGSQAALHRGERQCSFHQFVARKVARLPLKRRIIHDIVRGPTTGGPTEIVIPATQIGSATFNFCLIFRHSTDHSHVVHDCSRTAVDVPVCAISSDTVLLGEDELFGDEITLKSISKIPFRMQKRTKEKLITWSAEETRVYKVVKLDIMPFSKCAITDKRDWWRAATKSIQFVTSSNVDPLYMHLNAIQEILNKRMKNNEEKQKEEKDVNSKFG